MSEGFLFLPEEVNSLDPRMCSLNDADCYVVLAEGLENLILRDRKAAGDLDKVTNASLAVVDTAIARTRQINRVRESLDEIRAESMRVDDSAMMGYEKRSVIHALDWTIELVENALKESSEDD